MNEEHLKREHGRAFIANGQLYYSPNCTRIVEPPPDIDCNAQNPLNVTGPRRSYRPWNLSIQNYRRPLWWSEVFGFLAFFPLLPTFTTPKIYTLLFSKMPYELNSDNRITMDSARKDEWWRLDRALRQTAHILRFHYDIPVFIPISPCEMGFGDSFREPRHFDTAVSRAKDWFVVWMGLVSYLVAKAESADKRYTSAGLTTKQKWREVILEQGAKYGLDQSWLDVLTSSTIYQYTDSNERAGVFLQIPDSQGTQPNVLWLNYYRIPVWYPWSQAQAENRALEAFAPLPFQLQAAFTYIPKQPTSDLQQEELHRLIKFLEMKSKRQLKANNGSAQSTSGVEHAWDVGLADVYVWSADPSGTYVRQKVKPEYRQQILNSFSLEQTRVDPNGRVYDCCLDLGPGLPGSECEEDGDADADADADAGGVEFAEEYEAHEQVVSNESHPDDLLHISTPPSFNCAADKTQLEDLGAFWRPPTPDHDDLPTCVESHEHEPSIETRLVQEIHDILRLHFGYMPTIPLASCNPDELSSQTTQRAFLRTLGLTIQNTPSNHDIFFALPGILNAHQFLSSLARNSSPHADVWDLSDANRQPIKFTDRFRAIKEVTTTEQEILFLFDFDGVSPVDWKLAVKTASDALLICRLDPEWDEIDIVRFLLQNGIPFQTFQTIQSLSSLPNIPRPALSIPQRPSDYTFDTSDYRSYRDQCLALLRHPRGRAALMRGNTMWRIAMNVVDWEWVYQGPSGLVDDEGTIRIEWQEEIYIDDRLTEGEMLLLCGQYKCETDRSDQFALKSWYMPPTLFEGSANNHGRWAPISETSFKILDNNNILTRQPHSMSKWRNFARSSHDLRRAKLYLESQSLKLIRTAQRDK